MPAALINNLRVIAPIRVYDHIFSLDSIKLIDMQIIVYSGFHSNPRTIYPQIEDVLTTRGCTMKKCQSSQTVIPLIDLSMVIGIPSTLT